jgi:uncharacterized membrane protein
MIVLLTRVPDGQWGGVSGLGNQAGRPGFGLLLLFLFLFFLGVVHDIRFNCAVLLLHRGFLIS